MLLPVVEGKISWALDSVDTEEVEILVETTPDVSYWPQRIASKKESGTYIHSRASGLIWNIWVGLARNNAKFSSNLKFPSNSERPNNPGLSGNPQLFDSLRLFDNLVIEIHD